MVKVTSCRVGHCMQSNRFGQKIKKTNGVVVLEEYFILHVANHDSFVVYFRPQEIMRE